MIVGLIGDIVTKEPTRIELLVQGVIYELFVSVNCSNKIEKNNIQIHTTHIIKEDSSKLFGFMDKQEQKLFDRVIKINGVGPKVAMAICSTFTPAVFGEIVQNKNIDMIKSVPGIGPRGASRLLVELSGFIVDTQGDAKPYVAETYLALESLGFKKDKIKKAIDGNSETNTASLVKYALKKLQN
ncbi:MAG: Holliday junction branch migration protein RuvA [Campylobacteraceae bacterium 4484_166]|nr:MAG: Holliday junction branch migration protein RuvA [Campylobacteraceae bacterium 4484_166]